MPILLLLAWGALSSGVMVPPTGRDLAYSEVLRLGTGVLIYFGAGYLCHSRERLRLMVWLLLGGGLAAGVAGLLSDEARAAYGNPQLLAAFLVMLLPVALVFAHRQGPTGARRLLASVAAVLIVGALLLTSNRSAWLGSAAGAATVLLLALRTRAGLRLRQPHRWVVALLLAPLALTLLLAFSARQGQIGSRTLSLSRLAGDVSFGSRLRLWGICEQIVRSRPLTGSGIGSFPLVAGQYAVGAPAPRLLAGTSPLLLEIDGRAVAREFPPPSRCGGRGFP